MTPRDRALRGEGKARASARQLMREASKPLPRGRPPVLHDAVRVVFDAPRQDVIRWRMAANKQGVSMSEYLRGRLQ